MGHHATARSGPAPRRTRAASKGAGRYGIRSSARRFRSALLGHDLDRWVVLAVTIGVVAGLGAVLLSASLQFATHVMLGSAGGYHPPVPVGEGNAAASGTSESWRIPAVAALGGLLCGLIVLLAREAAGDGTNGAIEAIRRDPKQIRGRVSLIKVVASAVTIGSGGSGGPEGPTTQVSAGFASVLARRLGLSPADARIAVTAAVGAGIGAIFRAPLGGAVFGASVPYREDADVEALIPSMIAAIVAFSVFGAFEGYGPIFGTPHGFGFAHHPVEFLYVAAIGIACGLSGRLYAWSFGAARRIFSNWPVHRVLRPVIGGLAAGLVGTALPGAIGTGYGWVQTCMGPGLLHISPLVIVALPFAKILTTSLSIGSGGSGGIFGPGMVIGGFTGAAVWWLLRDAAAPSLSAQPGPLVIVGMVACLGAIAHTQLAAILMVVEMTGSLTALPPAMLALGIASLITGEATLYSSQGARRATDSRASLNAARRAG